MPTLFQPKWGLKSDLPEETTPGSIYITTDTQEIFLDTSGGGRISLNLLAGGQVDGDVAINGSFTPEVILPHDKSGTSVPMVYLPRLSYTDLQVDVSDISAYLVAWLKWICSHYTYTSGAIFIASVRPSTSGIVICYIYDTTAGESGLPQYCSGLMIDQQVDLTLRTFGVNNYQFSTSVIGANMAYAQGTLSVDHGGTGASTADAARANLGAAAISHSHSTFSPQNLPSGTNLNSLTNPGFYYSPANATVATFANCPTSNAFFLMVGQHAGTYQRLVEYPTSNPRIFFRNFYNGSWGSWFREFTTVDVPTYSQVGAAASSHSHDVGSLSGILPINHGGHGGSSVTDARYNLHVPAEVMLDSTSGVPFPFGILCAKGDLGNTIGQATADNYYWGVDSTATLWGGRQVNRATSPTWYKALMMDGSQNYQHIWSGKLTGTNSITLTDAAKYAALILCGFPGNGDEGLQFTCVPAGSTSPCQFCSSQYWFTYSLTTSGNDVIIKITENPNSGDFIYCWGILRHTP